MRALLTSGPAESLRAVITIRQSVIVCFYLLLLHIESFRINFNEEPRIIGEIHPRRLTVTIRPRIPLNRISEEYKFEGEMVLLFSPAHENVTRLEFHTRDIKVSKTAYIYKLAKIREEQMNIDYEEFLRTEKILYTLEEPLDKNYNYTIHLKFKGSLEEKMPHRGLFRASIDASENDFFTSAFSNMQNINARSIFPCLDDPIYKPIIEINIIRQPHFQSYSNANLAESKMMNITDAETGNDLFFDKYERIPAMAINQLVLSVVPYKNITRNNITFIGRAKLLENSEFSHNLIESALEAFNNYTEQPYYSLGISSLRVMASPVFTTDSSSWGFFTFPEEDLMLDLEDNWLVQKPLMFKLMYHVAKTWFSSSVTMSWWNELWLSEALSIYFAYYLGDEIAPFYNFKDLFYTEIMHPSLEKNEDSRMLPESSFITASQINVVEDLNKYRKHVCIIHMLSSILGPDRFKDAIQKFLKENRHKTTNPDAFFDYLQDPHISFGGKNVTQFVGEWFEGTHVPVLKVQVTNELTYFIQQLKPEEQKTYYPLPVICTTNIQNYFENTSPDYYINDGEERDFSFGRQILWVICNIEQTGYYRVLYDKYIVTNIAAALAKPEFSGIPAITRAQLINDLFYFGERGDTSYKYVMRLMKYLSTETEYLPWTTFFSGLRTISRRLHSRNHKALGTFVLNITENIYNNLGFNWTDSSPSEVMLRNEVIYWVCRFKHKDCLNETQKLAMHMPPADYRETIFCSANRYGSWDIYQRFKNLFADATTIAEKKMYARVIGCTSNFWREHYHNIMSENIPQEYKIETLKPMYRENPENVHSVFVRILNSVHELADVVGSWKAVNEMFCDMANYLFDDWDHHRLRRYRFLFHRVIKNKNEMEDAVKIAQYNIAQNGKVYQPLIEFIKGPKNPPPEKNILNDIKDWFTRLSF